MSFYLSKILWWIVQPGNLLVLLLAACAVLLWTGWRRLARGIIGAIAVSLTLILLFPLGDWLITPLENRFERPDTLPRLDGIIVLGGGFELPVLNSRGLPELNAAGDRYTALVALARQHPEAKLILTGGDPALIGHKGAAADVKQAFFTDLGLPPERIIFENHSRNTHENVLKSKALIGPQTGQKWVLVTSAAHMPRSVGLFRKAGWPVIAYPVDYRAAPAPELARQPDFSRNLRALDHAVKEWVGLAAYYAMGRTDSLFPGPDMRTDAADTKPADPPAPAAR